METEEEWENKEERNKTKGKEGTQREKERINIERERCRLVVAGPLRIYSHTVRISFFFVY